MRSLLLLLTTFCLAADAQDLKSGGKLKPEQAIMDIRHYTLVLDVDPVNKEINGHTEIELDLLKPASKLLFDLWSGLKVSKVSVDGVDEEFSHTRNDLLNITLKQDRAAGKVKVKIVYGGKPAVAVMPPWVGGFQWSKDSTGNPWIAVSCQGEGAKIYFPCKDHPSDEPDEGAEMMITVPEGLVVAGPGLLQNVATFNGRSTFHWKTNYTISNYCILFNIGKYKVAKRVYTTVTGNKVPMEYYVLEENFDKADKLLDLFEQSARILEKYFGEYPWVKERIAASETPHLGMEHQTNIAYGNKYRYTKVGTVDFDWLLHHEFGHEWWANKVTNRDWAHMWIQEGICVFGDAMAVRDLAGEAAYREQMKNTEKEIRNKIPIVQGEEVDSDKAYHGDIYGKGAFFMHTLRHVMGDSVFFPALKRLATDPQYTYGNTVITADVEQLFSKAYGASMKPLFHLYLYTNDKVQFLVKPAGNNSYQVRILNIDMRLPVDIVTDSGIHRYFIDKAGVSISSKTALQVDPHINYFKTVVFE